MVLEFVRGTTIGEIISAAQREGVPVAGGFLAGSIIGRKLEDRVMGKDAAGMQKTVTETDTLGTKIKAWAANNGPKLALWYIAKRYEGSPFVLEGKKGLMGSVGLDTLYRLTSKGVPVRIPTILGLGGVDTVLAAGSGGQGETQKLIQENSRLRVELNKAMQQLASGQPVVSTAYPEIREREFGFMQTPESIERQRKYGAMVTPPAVEQRERKFGFAGGSTADTGATSMATLCGML